MPHTMQGAPVEEHFWAYVDKTDTCWLWTGFVMADGYGQFSVHRPPHGSPKKLRAHRYAYTISIGPILEHLALDHLCRIRHCVNPAHLEPVTTRENLRRAGKISLTDEKLRQIRLLHEQGLSSYKIARAVNAPRSTVWDAITRLPSYTVLLEDNYDNQG